VIERGSSAGSAVVSGGARAVVAAAVVAAAACGGGGRSASTEAPAAVGHDVIGHVYIVPHGAAIYVAAPDDHYHPDGTVDMGSVSIDPPMWWGPDPLNPHAGYRFLPAGARVEVVGLRPEPDGDVYLVLVANAPPEARQLAFIAPRSFLDAADRDAAAPAQWSEARRAELIDAGHAWLAGVR
jgi:hypothetical protein